MPEPVFVKAPVWTWKKFYARVLGVFVLLGAYTFFFSGGKKEAAKTAERPTEAPRIEEFTVNAGEEVVTVVAGPGTFHRVRANKPWIAMSRQVDGSYREYQARAGASSWKGVEPEGLLRVKGLENGTILRFERVHR